VTVAASDDALSVLGLPADASADDVRAARRALAKTHHPDRGGDAASMQTVNEAADAALENLAAAAPAQQDEPPDEPWSRLSRDIPSFTVEALPVETFEGLLIVASWMGEVLDDDPPYRLDTHLYEPSECWCRLDVVPDAGSSTVSLTIAGLDGSPPPDITAVRDLWVANLNAVDWV
jgi:hypothetical protein